MKLRYDPRALTDLKEIHKFIAEADAHAASRAILRIERAINRLKTSPWSGRKGVVSGTRLLVVPSLPYIVVHKVEDDAITIVAVLHTRRQRRY